MADTSFRFHVKINGEAIDAVHRKHFSNIRFEGSFDDTDTITWTISESHNFAPSNRHYAVGAKVDFFFMWDTTPVQIFHGEITELTRSYSDELSTIEVVCYDLSYKLKRNVGEQAMLNKESMVDNIMLLIQGFGLTHFVAHPKFKLPKVPVNQSITFGPKTKNKTPWKALHRISKTFNLRLFVRHQTLFMVDDDFIQKNQPLLFDLVYNKPLSELVDGQIPVIDMTIKNEVRKIGGVKSVLWTPEEIDALEKEQQAIEDENKRQTEYFRKLGNIIMDNAFTTAPPEPADASNVESEIVLPEDLYPSLPTWGIPEEAKALEAVRNLSDSQLADVVAKYLGDVDYVQPQVVPKFTEEKTDALSVYEPPIPDAKINKSQFPDGTVSEDIFSQDQMDRAVDAWMEEEVRRLTTVDMNIEGHVLMQKGHRHFLTIYDSLGDFSASDSGEYTIEKVTHEIDSDGFKTNLQWTRPAVIAVDIKGTVVKA
jgi:hypothetical protein